MLIFVSCSTESVGTGEEIVQDQPENTITTPCDFDLQDLAANSTVTIDCVLDLNGETISLPSNVNFEFGKGDIVNGKLIFSGGTIDGRLLSSKLEVEGDVKLKDPEFKFYALRWDIVEGKTTSDIALKNNQELERLMEFTKQLGATVFKIDRFDAYFNINTVTSTTTNQNWYPSKEAVNIPSDFHLSMSDNTHLRMIPGGAVNLSGCILAVREVSNVSITGGNLHGDRDERIYSPNDTGLEGNHLMHIHSGKNVTIDGVNFEEGSSGSITIYSTGFSFNPNYDPTTNLKIINCKFKNSRRMAIALTDGRDVLIEGNTFIDTGLPSKNSDGGEVGYAINIEPDRYRDDNGILMERQKVFDVDIKNNTERGSRGGFVTLTIGQNLTVQDNDIGTRVVYSLVSESKVINNRFKATGTAVDSWAIFAAGTGETVFNNEIAGNSIEGYSLGVVVGSNEAYVHENTIKECGSGIQLSKAFKARIHDNTINVTGNGIQATNTHGDEIEIKGNEITSGSFLVYFAQMNNKEEHKNNTLVFEDNTFKESKAKAVTFSNINGVTFKNNEVHGGLEIGNVNNIKVMENTIRPKNRSGVRLFSAHNQVSILNNTIYEPTGGNQYECIENNSENPNSIEMEGNTCN